MTDIGHRLKAARKLQRPRSHSQEDAARRIGVSAHSVSRWERGDTPKRLARNAIERYCRAAERQAAKAVTLSYDFYGPMRGIQADKGVGFTGANTLDCLLQGTEHAHKLREQWQCATVTIYQDDKPVAQVFADGVTEL